MTTPTVTTVMAGAEGPGGRQTVLDTPGSRQQSGNPYFE